MDTKNVRISGFADEIDEALDKQLSALQKLGMHYVEMRGVDGKGLVRCSDEEIEEIQKKLAAADVRLSSVGSPIGKVYIDDDFEAHFELYKRTVEIAKKMNTPYIRMFSFWFREGTNPDDYKDVVVERLTRMIDYARANNVILLHENEKDIFGDTIARCKFLMEKLYCDNFKAVFDFANFVQCGEDTWNAYNELRPYIAYIHIKDALYSNGSVVPPGQGDGQLEKILGAMFQDGYDGFLSLEPHLSDFTGFGALEKGEHQQWRSLSGEEAFALAHTSLLNILNSI